MSLKELNNTLNGKLSAKQEQDFKKIVEKAEKNAKALAEHHLSIFQELMKLPQFKEWMNENIRIKTEVSHVNKSYEVYVAYIGDHPDNLTNFDKMERIRGVFMSKNSPEAMLEKIKEIAAYDVTTIVPKEESKDESEDAVDRN
jgi:hypothetical protein